MTDLNVVTIVGRVGADPELREIPNSSDKVCSLGVANSSHRKVGEEWQEQTSWFDVSFFGRQAESVAERVRKGHRIAVTGRLKQRTWEAQDGTKRSAVGISASQVQFLEKKGAGSPAGGDDVPF